MAATVNPHFIVAGFCDAFGPELYSQSIPLPPEGGDIRLTVPPGSKDVTNGPAVLS